MRAGLLCNPVFDAEAKFIEGGEGTVIELAVVQDFLDVFQIRSAGGWRRPNSRRPSSAWPGRRSTSPGRCGRRSTRCKPRTRLELRRTVVAATEASYDFARRLHEAGNLRELDLVNERATYEQSKLDVRAAEADVLARASG